MARSERQRITFGPEDEAVIESTIREACSDAYARGVRDTLARLTEPRVRAVVVTAMGGRETASPAVRRAYESGADAILAAVAAALAPRPEDTRERVVTTDEDGNEFMVLTPGERRS